MSRTFSFAVLVLLLGGAAGAMHCGNKPRVPATEPPPSRRELQRSSMREDHWQFVVCGDGDIELRAYVDSCAAARPFGKSIDVVDCNALLAGVPSIIFGTQLPSAVTGLAEALVRPPIGYQSGDVIVVNNFLQSSGEGQEGYSTVSAYLGPSERIVLDHLRATEHSDWGGIFRGRWGYEVYTADGGVRYGSYHDGNWTFDRAVEIDLPSVGPPIISRDRTDYYAVDGAITVDELRSLLDRVPGALQDSSLSAVYIYPDVARLGLRRGNMAPRQLDGMALHVVRSELYPNDLAVPFPPNTFLRGMTFAHEGYRVYNGYGGTTVAPALDSLLKLEINALAIVPYTFMRDAGIPGELPVPTDAGSENDGAVQYAIRQAHERGLAVLLKPQIWVGGSWPGEVTFATPQQWEQFFTAYKPWILHYARMAEAEGVGGLCIGTELVRTTLEHPDRWRAMIAAIRKVYRGKLTYAANWGEEFEQLTFWDDLDAIGLNSYYPLATVVEATDAELLHGAERWMHLADSIATLHDRPLWLTEVGYRSVTAAWINPHAEAGDRAANAVAQARCYRALVAVAAESERLQGMFVWKWPSYLGYQDWGGEDTGFTPGGKPAASVLQEFYRSVEYP